jgi:phage repressor protein C with HTH and peptisase S24 domain
MSELTHQQLWDALDRLAKRAGLSPSGLAKKAGLDATAFNRSKRVAANGRPRWPSMESIAKALAATGVSFKEFAEMVEKGG